MLLCFHVSSIRVSCLIWSESHHDSEESFNALLRNRVRHWGSRKCLRDHISDLKMSFVKFDPLPPVDTQLVLVSAQIKLGLITSKSKWEIWSRLAPTPRQQSVNLTASAVSMPSKTIFSTYHLPLTTPPTFPCSPTSLGLRFGKDTVVRQQLN